jgi:hypothetical protein
MEIWKSLERMPGYEISSYGKVKSLKGKKPKLLKIATNNVGYNLVCLMNNKIRCTSYIHRLVAEAFIPTGLDKNIAEVNHKDKNPKNNHVDNLEWTNYSQNRKHKLDSTRYFLYQQLDAMCDQLNNQQLELLINYGKLIK